MKADRMIAKHEELLDKITSGEYKIPESDKLPKSVVIALAKHDLKLLEETKSDIERATSLMRQKAHEEILGECRLNHM